MHGSNKFARVETLAALCALSLLAVPVVGTILDHAGQNPSAEIERYRTQCADAENNYRAFIKEFPKAPIADKEAPERDYEQQYRAQYTNWCDLAAQQTSAEATVRAAEESIWVTRLTALGVFLLIWTLWETMRVTAVTREASKDQSRAYVHAYEARFYEEPGERFGIYIKNTGQSPAKNFEVHFMICHHPSEFPSHDWYGDFSEVTDKVSATWSALGAGDNTSIACIVYDLFNINSKTLSSGKLCIKGKIFYETIFDETYRTDFIFTLDVPADPGRLLEDSNKKKYWFTKKPATKPSLLAFSQVGGEENQKHKS